ncbi:armadillo-type protein [Pavlovales sp. CCMP2436]|nr:armadillo-type protein [Pavlovales sp. CCMP2436]
MTPFSHDSSCTAHCVLCSQGAWALANLSADVRNALPIVEAGALEVLFRLMGSDSGSVQLQATWVFANLSVVDELKSRIGAQPGFVEILYARLAATSQDSDSHRPLRLQTIRTLANLAVDSANRSRVAVGLGVAVDALIDSSRDEISQATLRLMVNLSYDTLIAATMLRNGGLVRALLEHAASASEAIQQEAVLCLVNLSLDDASESTLVAAGALPPLVAILRGGSPVLQEQAAWALSNITTTNDSKMRVIELGALHTLKGLHRSSTGQMRQASTKIMTSLLAMVTPQSRKVQTKTNRTIFLFFFMILINI